ncbi:hypothetical protein ACIBO2_58525 [Nonomuraea sp. NPDC050022]
MADFLSDRGDSGAQSPGVRVVERVEDQFLASSEELVSSEEKAEE